MARTSIDRGSVEYLRVPVSAPSGVTLGTQVVEMAVVAGYGQPAAEDWHAAAWESGTSNVRALIGSGDFVLTPGQYRVFVKITDAPEAPVLVAGTLVVT